MGNQIMNGNQPHSDLPPEKSRLVYQAPALTLLKIGGTATGDSLVAEADNGLLSAS